MEEKIDVIELLANKDVPHVYANGFVLSSTAADAMLILQLNGEPIQVLHMSYTSLKSLSQIANTHVTKFQKITGMDIMTIGEIKEKLNPVEKQFAQAKRDDKRKK